MANLSFEFRPNCRQHWKVADSRFVIGVTEEHGHWDRLRLEDGNRCHRCEPGERSAAGAAPRDSRRCADLATLGAAQTSPKIGRREEFEDLHRMQREGLGRIQEWRDASAVGVVAKWRALAQIATGPDESFLHSCEWMEH